MNTNTILNKVRILLGMEVVLEQMKLADGVTVFEADSFEAGNAVVIVTEDEQKIPVPIGEYELEDGRILVVIEEGVISEIKEVTEEEEMPEAPAEEVPTEAAQEMEAEKTNPKKTVESIIKETFFSEIEALKKENEELKAKLETLSKVEPIEEEVKEEETVELSEVKPIVHNPENEVAKEVMKFASKRPRSIMDSVLDKINK